MIDCGDENTTDEGRLRSYMLIRLLRDVIRARPPILLSSSPSLAKETLFRAAAGVPNVIDALLDFKLVGREDSKALMLG